MHSDSKKRRSFLTLLSIAGDLRFLYTIVMVPTVSPVPTVHSFSTRLFLIRSLMAIKLKRIRFITGLQKNSTDLQKVPLVSPKVNLYLSHNYHPRPLPVNAIIYNILASDYLFSRKSIFPRYSITNIMQRRTTSVGPVGRSKRKET